MPAGALQCRHVSAVHSSTFRVQSRGRTADGFAPALPAVSSCSSRQWRWRQGATPQAAQQRSSTSSPRLQQQQQQQQPQKQQLARLSTQQEGNAWLPLQSRQLGSYATAAAAAAAVGLGGLLAANPAAASEFLSGSMQQAGAFIPGLVGDDPVREGFIQALLLIFFSEIGDKTFFIALLLALQQPRALVFGGTFGALAVMTVISVGLGRFLHLLDEVVPTGGLPLDDILAITLLIWFGVQTLRSAATAGEKAAEEKEEAQEVVDGFGSGAEALGMLASTFTLVFAAEWGDKSFLATIALAAASSPTGVVLGAVAGHAIATVIAVLGGSFLGKYLDEKVVQYVGGSLFLVFAAASIYDIAVGAA